MRRAMTYRDFIQDYIKTAQEALAVLSVDDQEIPTPGKSSFLVFELLDYSETQVRIFRPYVYDKLSLEEEDLKRLKETASEEEKSNLQSKTVADLRKFIDIYESAGIQANRLATALIYQAWKQRKLLDLRRPDATIRKALFMEVNKGTGFEKLLDDMRNYLGLHLDKENRFSDGSEWIIAEEHLQPTPNLNTMNWIEFALIHKVKPEALENFYLIHYPLIINDYWFMGFAYLLKEKEARNSNQKKAEIFDDKKYPKCLSLINVLVKPLKLAMWEKARENIDWKKPFQNILFEVARKYFACFDVRITTDKADEGRGTKLLPYKNLLDIYGPEWILSELPEAKDLLKKELDDISRLVQDEMQRKDAEWKDINRMLRHNVLTYLAVLERAKDPEARAFCMDDLKNIVDSTRHLESEKELREFVGGEFERSKNRNCSILDHILKPITARIINIITGDNIGVLRAKEDVENTLKRNWKTLFDFTKIGNDIIETIPWLTRLIFKDLLTNAVKNVNLSSPKVSIKVYGESETRVKVEITNNMPIDEKYRRQIKDKNAVLQDPGHLGIFLYKRYMYGLGWSIDIPDDSSQYSNTTLRMIIPRQFSLEA
jgi:hypothetical protein